ncbi:MAG TPA: hypothetical protein VE978_01345 [Chitinophagales bacterium]|nr:hypothetical protein [Chitinophagales bacterium]
MNAKPKKKSYPAVAATPTAKISHHTLIYNTKLYTFSLLINVDCNRKSILGGRTTKIDGRTFHVSLRRTDGGVDEHIPEYRAIEFGDPTGGCDQWKVTIIDAAGIELTSQEGPMDEKHADTEL